MFKKQFINKERIVDYWIKDVRNKEVVKHAGQKYQIHKKEQEFFILATDDNFLKNPIRVYVQGRVSKESKLSKHKIIVEPKLLIERLYYGLILSISVFCIFMVKESIYLSLGMLIVFGGIFYYNTYEINKGILAFKNELEKET